jgi:transcriptional regulator with XRE-family HTH domain
MLYDDDHTVYNEFINQETSLVDILIGRRIRNRRTILGITQKDLGKIVGVSPQQIQKYETASNRVSCSTLYAFSRHLKAPIYYFFENKDHNILSVNEEQESFSQESFFIDEIQEKEIIKLINFYKSIEDKGLRKKIYELIESISVSKKINA